MIDRQTRINFTSPGENAVDLDGKRDLSALDPDDRLEHLLLTWASGEVRRSAYQCEDFGTLMSEK